MFNFNDILDESSEEISDFNKIDSILESINCNYINDSEMLEYSNYESFDEYVLNDMITDGFFSEDFNGYDTNDLSSDIFKEFADLFVEKSETINGIKYSENMDHSVEAFKKRWKYDKKSNTICIEDRYILLNYPCNEKETSGIASVEFNPFLKSVTNKKVEVNGKKVIVGKLNLGKSFFNIQALYQDAILFHEMGHYIMQMYPNKGMPKSIKDFFKRIVDFFKRIIWLIRARFKYGKDVHGIPSRELEADAFAAKRYGKDVMKDLLKGLPEIDLAGNPKFEKHLKKNVDDVIKCATEDLDKQKGHFWDLFQSYRKKHPNESDKQARKSFFKLLPGSVRVQIIESISKQNGDIKNRIKALDDNKLFKSANYGRMKI